MGAATDLISDLPLSASVALIALLTAVRLVLRTGRTAVFRFSAEVVESITLAAAAVFLVLRPFVVHSYHIPTGSMDPTLRVGDHILVNKIRYRFMAPEHGHAVVFRAPVEADRQEREFVKRLVGLPGDTIEVRPGYVMVGNIVFGHPEIREILRLPPRATDNSPVQGARLRLASDALWIDDQPLPPAEFARRAGAPPGLRVRIQPGMVLRNGNPMVEDYVAEDPDYRVPELRVPTGFSFVLGDNRNQSHDSHRWGLLRMERIVGKAEFVFWPPRRVRPIP